jgi:WD40 repeat protein
VRRFEDGKDNFETVQALEVGADIQPFDFFPTGERIAFATPQRKIQVYSVADARTAAKLDLDKGLVDASTAAMVALSSDGTKFAVRTGRTRITAFAVDSPQLALTLSGSPRNSSDIWSVRWSPDGEKLAVACADGTVRVWRMDRIAEYLSQLGLGVDWK